jgi:hypothetical protein
MGRSSICMSREEMWLPLGNFGVMQGNLAGRDWPSNMADMGCHYLSKLRRDSVGADF